MNKENYENVKKGKATAKDFPFTLEREAEIKETMDKELRENLYRDELDFNREVQIVVLNLMKKHKLTTSYVVGTLYKLAFGILQDDFIMQIKYMDEMEKDKKR
ncbi:MAG: hypothetical protein AABY22_11340 [Nanoarchaeota archaeon]